MVRTRIYHVPLSNYLKMELYIYKTFSQVTESASWTERRIKIFWAWLGIRSTSAAVAARPGTSGPRGTAFAWTWTSAPPASTVAPWTKGRRVGICRAVTSAFVNLATLTTRSRGRAWSARRSTSYWPVGRRRRTSRRRRTLSRWSWKLSLELLPIAPWSIAPSFSPWSSSHASFRSEK